MYKKNVLIISYRLIVGGSELNALKLSKVLPYNFFWLSFFKKKIDYFLKFRSIRKFFDLNLEESKKKFSLLNFIFSLIKLQKILRLKKIDTVYAIGFLPGLLASVIKLFTKINLITTRRGADKSHETKYFIPNLIINILSDTIETNSKSIYKENKKKFILRNKIKYVENIIPKHLVCKKKKKNNKRRHIVGIIANLRPIKNPNLLKSLVENLCEKKNHIYFNLIGRDYKNYYKNLKKRYKKKISWKKFVPNEKISNFYNSIDTLLITSFFESSPNIILEAFSNGIPVVSTPNKGSKNYIINNYNGEISADFNSRSLILCLHKVLTFKKKYSNNSKKFFIKNYNFEKNINKIKSYF